MSTSSPLGRFSVSREFLLESDLSHLQNVFHPFIVLRTQDRLDFPNTVEFLARSNLFEDVEAGHMIPEYSLTIRVDDSVEAKRILLS